MRADVLLSGPRFRGWACWTTVSVLLPITVLAGFACRGPSPRMTAYGCEPVEGTDLSGFPVDELAGEYRLTMVAEGGEAKRTTGELWLHVNEQRLRGIQSVGGQTREDASAPLYGSTDIDVEAVDAVRLGDLTSRDPEQPGVLVIDEGGGILLRLGSEANRRDRVRFDGGFLALRVRQVTDGGFAGVWTSGVTGVEARGYFCAERVGG